MRLGGETDPLITAMLDEQPNIRMVTRMESCPVYGDRCAQFIFSNDPEGKIDALDLAPSCLLPELKQSRGIVPNRRTKIVMATIVHFWIEDLRQDPAVLEEVISGRRVLGRVRKRTIGR